jgi:hypothetical protein
MRYIEVKGRARVGAVEFSENEWLKAEQLGKDYWLYVITDALKASALHLPREEVIPQVRYRVAQQGWHRVAESGGEWNRDVQCG